jgi:hypothetical protein
MRVRRQLVQQNISKRAYEKGNCFETQCMKLNTKIDAKRQTPNPNPDKYVPIQKL